MRIASQTLLFLFFVTAIQSDHAAHGENPLLDGAPRAAAVGRLRNAYREGRIQKSEYRRFNLDYVLEGIDSKKEYRVDVWGTDDLGQTWTRWGDDPDKVSPVNLETSGNGIYGFLIVVNVKGTQEQQPKRGQDADIWVNVNDSTSVLTLAASYGLDIESAKIADPEPASSVDVPQVRTDSTVQTERRRWRFFRRRF
jgi:hypothetical protein